MRSKWPGPATVGKGVYSQLARPSRGFEPFNALSYTYRRAILTFWPAEIPPTRQLCKKRPGLGNKEAGFKFDLEKGSLYVK